MKHLGNIELVKALLILKSSCRVVVSDKEMIIAAFYGCSGSHELTELEDMQHWSPNGPSRTNGQNTVLTMKMKNNQKIWKDCQRHSRQTKTNQGEGKTFLTFAFCVSRKTLDHTPKKTLSVLAWLNNIYIFCVTVTVNMLQSGHTKRCTKSLMIRFLEAWMR